MVKITVSKNELLSKLKAVSKVINTSNKVTPAHANFLFEIGSEFKVTGADEMGNITTNVDCVISGETELSFLIDAKLLIDGLKELPEQPIIIDIEKKDDSIFIRLIHNSGTYNLNGGDPRGYSKVEVCAPEMKTIEMDSAMLITGIKKVYQFAGNDELRPIFTSVYIESRNGKLIFVSTNTSTMAVYQCQPAFSYQEFDIILPVKIAKILADLLTGEDSVSINITEKNVAFNTNSKAINYRLLEGKYPAYRSIIPKSNNKVLNCSTDGIISAIRRTSIFANKNSQLLILSVKQSLLEISGKDIDLQNSANEKISVSYSDEPLEIGFKSEFLLKCLESIETDEVSLSFSDPTKACLITPAEDVEGDLTVLIMPLLVNI